MTVVEVIVAIAIFSILATVAYEIYIGVDDLVKRSDQKSQALWLAEEGIEAARSIRDENFVNLTDGTYGLSNSGDKWALAGSSDVNNAYTRVLNISTINPDEKEVLVTIDWDYKGVTNSLNLNSHLTNWHAIDYNAGLTVEKVVINHGGNATSSRFSPYTVSITVGTTTTDTIVESGVANQFAPGTYTVTEATDPDYTQTFELDCDSSGQVVVVASSTKVCRIINEEKPAKLRVNKTVINHGNSKVVSDFSLLVDSNPVTSGVLNTFDSGLHTVSEIADSEYDMSIGGDCDASGQITLISGATKTCSVINEEKLAYVSIYKNLINYGGSAVVADFEPYKVGATTVTLGATTTKNSGTYTVSETVNPAYTQTFSGDCDGAGLITLVGGTTKTCTIINEEKLVVPTVTTPTISSISTSSAILGANVTSTGVPHTIIARGTCYSTSPNPTLTNGAVCLAEGTTTTGAFTHLRTGLTTATTYYFSGYATNSTGTGYSTDGTFTTTGGACQVTGIVPTTYDNSSSVSAVVTKPTGVIQNDIMFAYIMHNNSTDRLSTIPTGWTQIGRHKNGNANQALYYKVAGASEPASYTFGLISSSRLAVTINVYRGCFNLLNPIDTISNTGYVVNNTTYRAASMTLPSQYTTVIIFPSVSASGSKTFAAPITQGGGWTQNYTNGNASSQFSRSAFSKLITNTGATGVIDSIGFSASNGKHAFAVGLHPL